MRIKRLELFGFKTFPNRTILSFSPGISAIVGPNGAGKSNIVDALRWILGEQNPRHLRVREMSDLIFAGDNSRRPEFAEVKLVLENEQGRGPKDLAHLPEIVVARRLYRDGESEFFLNNRLCRLKDIVYLFLDTGAHARGYGIIDQGQVGQFLEQSPKERRRFLEELAGIARYKLKKEETVRQLERSRENLLRLKDILTEVDNQLKKLEKQAEKAKLYLKLQEELKGLELSRLNQLYLTTSRKKEKLLPKRQELQRQNDRLRQEYEELLPQREEVSAEAELLREEIQKLEENWQKIMADLRRAEQDYENILQEENNLARNIASLTGKLGEKEQQLKELKSTLEEIKKRKKEASQELFEIKEEKEVWWQKKKKLDKTRREIEQKLKELDEKISSLKQVISSKERERKSWEKELSFLRKEAQKIENKKDTLATRYREIVREKEELLEEKRVLNQQLGSLSTQKAALAKEVETLKASLAKCREEESLLRLKLKELHQEVSWLTNFLAENSPEAIKVLKEAGYPAKMLFETVSLDEQEERTLELAFPELVKALWLPEGKREPMAFLKEKDVSALIYVGKDPELFLRKRLQKTVLKEELTLEKEAWVVSPAGDLLEPDGLLHLRGKKKAPFILSKRRKLIKTKEDLKCTEKELSQKTELRLRLEKHLADKEKELQKIKKELQEHEKELVSVEKRLDRLEIEEEKFTLERNVLYEKEREILAKTASLEEKLSQIKGEISSFLERQKVLFQEIEPLQKELDSIQKELRHVSSRIRDLELTSSALQERARQARHEEERLLKEEVKLANELERLKEKLNFLEVKLREIKKDLASRRKEVEGLREKEQNIKALLENKRKLLHEKAEKERSLSERLTKLVKEISKTEKQLNRLEVDLAELELTLRHLNEQALEKFGQTLPQEETAGVVSPSQLEREIEDIRAQLNRLGAVNLAALEELEQTKERKEFLLAQKNDLEKAIRDLEEAVRQINSKCRARLKEALEAANEKLNLVFALLFPGGKARLDFTEAQDLLEAGLELAVKLPGKPVRHLAMLSGGEKALTALAVLCAFYLVKPGPFCILDEVDAPLDEANTARFIQLLKELNRHSQIILVTHNKQVMEAADTLIGVTMEEKGVSKIVSVSLV